MGVVKNFHTDPKNRTQIKMNVDALGDTDDTAALDGPHGPECPDEPNKDTLDEQAVLDSKVIVEVSANTQNKMYDNPKNTVPIQKQSLPALVAGTRAAGVATTLVAGRRAAGVAAALVAGTRTIASASMGARVGVGRVPLEELEEVERGT